MPTPLMLSHVWLYLPTPLHDAYVCSAGTRGYASLKEMLQNGMERGNSMLLESGDLRDHTIPPIGGAYCTTFRFREEDSVLDRHANDDIIKKGIPALKRNDGALRHHVDVYCNMPRLPEILTGYKYIASINISRMPPSTQLSMRCFLSCTGLESLDLGSVSRPHLQEVPEYFLEGCCSLKSPLDLTPLSHVTLIKPCFMCNCSSLTHLDLGPLSNITEIPDSFLTGCSSLASLDLTPLSKVTLISANFLGYCTTLATLDLQRSRTSSYPHVPASGI